MGVVPTNGYRTPADIQRLRAQGYSPAANSLHLQGDAVDLTPGRSGLTLQQLQARAAAIANAWPNGRVLNEGDHIHLQLPGWHMAPGTPGTPNAGIPPLPPGAQLVQRGSLQASQGGMFAAPRAALNASTSLTPLALTGQAHDGDTVRLTNGLNGRLNGVDAFELNQTGVNGSGQTVPLGVQGRDFMLSRIGAGNPAFPVGDYSHGRPIINLSQNPFDDPAHDLLRLGLGIPEPQYLQGTSRFAPYMDAQRLARLNQLGGYQTNALSPPAFRHGGSSPFNDVTPGVPGQPGSMAVFKDEALPFTGYKPEVEKALVSIWQDPKATPEQYIEAGQQFGLTFDPKTVADKFASRFNKDGSLKSGPLGGKLPDPVTPPRPLVDPGDGAFGSFARGLGDPFNALDELGAIPDSLGLSPGRINIFNAPPGTRFGDVFANNLEQNREILAHDEAAHPYARLGGQLTSGVALPMGAADTPVQLAAIMAAQGGAAGFMGGEGNVTSRLPSAAVGAVGGALSAPLLYAGGKYLIAPAARAVGNAIFGRAGQRAATELPPLPEGFTVDPSTTALEHGDIGPLAATTSGAQYISPEMLQRINGGHVAADTLPPVPDGFTVSRAPSSAAMAADRGPELVGRVPDTIDVNALPPLPDGFKLGVSPEAIARAKQASSIAPETVIQPLDHGVNTVEEAIAANPSRFQDVQAPNENSVLGVRILTTAKGGKVAVRGPIDLTQSVRLMGGVSDEGGELAHLGLSNAPRRMDFGSNEQFLGRLINPDGLHPDEAAERLWEEGYFPTLREPPTGDELGHMLRDEQFGTRYFHPNDEAELSDFRAAQDQRHTVEQAINEGSPLADDNSEPVSLDDMLKRTAPDYAYTAPPSGKIGNLDFGKLEGGADLAGVMQHIEDALGDHPVQGAVANDQTKAAAHELGLSVQDFLATQPGQFDAKRIIAGRMLLHGALEATRRAAQKVVNGGSDADRLAFERAKLVTALIQDHMKGATAEIGRTLQALRIVSEKGDARIAAMRQFITQRGGHNAVDDSAKDFLDLAEDPAKANSYIQKNTKATWLQKANEAYTMALLSNPATHFRNFIGNTGALAIGFPEKAIEAGYSRIGQALGAPPEARTYLSEVPVRAKGMLEAMPDAWNVMKRTFHTGDPIDGASKLDAQQYHAISGRKGEIIRLPGRLMTAADELFKALHYAGEVSAQARRAAINSGGSAADRAAYELRLKRNPTEAIAVAGNVEARYRTFQQELGATGKILQQVSNTVPGAKLLLAFVRTPINLLKFAGERTPAAVLMPSVWRKLLTPGQPRYEALARMSFTSLALMGVAKAAVDGDITGNGPSDPRARAQLMASGWRPQSIKVGNHWLSYSNYDPFSSMIGMVADYAEAGKWATDKERQSIASNVMLSALNNFTDNAWFSGVTSFFGALSDNSKLPGWIANTAASFVPAGVNQIAHDVDPTIRDTRANGKLDSDPFAKTAQMTLDAIKARVPVVSEGLPVRRDIWGEPLQRDNQVGPDGLMPFRVTAMQSDPVSAELVRLREFPSMPQKQITDARGDKIDLTPKQYDEFVQLAGKPAKVALAQEMASPQWRSMPDAAKTAEVRSIISNMRDSARDEMRQRYPELGGQDQGSAPAQRAALPPLPPGFAIAH
jgi:endonuclease YncB( thermonuclease family)